MGAGGIGKSRYPVALTDFMLRSGRLGADGGEDASFVGSRAVY